MEKEEWKFETLCVLFDVLTNTEVIILCNAREKVSCSFFQISNSRTPYSPNLVIEYPNFVHQIYSQLIGILKICVYSKWDH